MHCFQQSRRSVNFKLLTTITIIFLTINVWGNYKSGQFRDFACNKNFKFEKPLATYAEIELLDVMHGDQNELNNMYKSVLWAKEQSDGDLARQIRETAIAVVLAKVHEIFEFDPMQLYTNGQTTQIANILSVTLRDHIAHRSHFEAHIKLQVIDAYLFRSNYLGDSRRAELLQGYLAGAGGELIAAHLDMFQPRIDDFNRLKYLITPTYLFAVAVAAIREGTRDPYLRHPERMQILETVEVGNKPTL
jgi:hypothetical protein